MNPLHRRSSCHADPARGDANPAGHAQAATTVQLPFRLSTALLPREPQAADWLPLAGIGLGTAVCLGTGAYLPALPESKIGINNNGLALNPSPVH